MLRLGWIKPKEPKRIYLDYAAATPVRPAVATRMREVQETCFANASAIHAEGQLARERIETSRLALARCLKIRPQGVVFTGSGTESNNLALYGTVRARFAQGVPYNKMTIISTKLEHPSITAVLDDLETIGVMVKYVAVTEDGLIDHTHLAALLDDSVVLVTIAYVNSEIGVVQDIGRITRLIKKYNADTGTHMLVHIDAAQAPLWLPCQFDSLGVDLLSLDAGKCYGPKGVGMLAFRHGVELQPIIRGGGQESGLRAATENTVGIVGGVEAIIQAQAECEVRSASVAALRDTLITKLEAIDGVILNGSRDKRVANNVNISIPGIDGEFAVVSLDAAGIAVSTKSACSGAGGGGSTVVETISSDAARASSTIRITLGEETTAAELDEFVTQLTRHITRTRKAQASLTQS